MKKYIITVYFLVDDFCKIFKGSKKTIYYLSVKIRQKPRNIILSDFLSIVLFFYLSSCRDFKNYYIHYLPAKYPKYFKLVSYSRII